VRDNVTEFESMMGMLLNGMAVADKAVKNVFGRIAATEPSEGTAPTPATYLEPLGALIGAADAAIREAGRTLEQSGADTVLAHALETAGTVSTGIRSALDGKLAADGAAGEAVALFQALAGIADAALTGKTPSGLQHEV
jgi:hypothetical protein